MLVYFPGVQVLRDLNLIEQSSKELRVTIVSEAKNTAVRLGGNQNLCWPLTIVADVWAGLRCV